MSPQVHKANEEIKVLLCHSSHLLALLCLPCLKGANAQILGGADSDASPVLRYGRALIRPPPRRGADPGDYGPDFPSFELATSQASLVGSGTAGRRQPYLWPAHTR